MSRQLIVIDLEQPLAEQQSVKELLNVSEDKAGRIELYQLLEIAKVAIKNELVACGASSDELVGLRLEFHCSEENNRGPGETYALEWGQKNQKKEENAHQLEKDESLEKLQSANNPSLLPTEYIHKLSERLNSEIGERARLAGTTISFRASSSTVVQYPCVDAGNKKFFLKILENGKDKGWYINPLGQKVPCNPDSLENIPIEE